MNIASYSIPQLQKEKEYRFIYDPYPYKILKLYCKKIPFL